MFSTRSNYLEQHYQRRVAGTDLRSPTLACPWLEGILSINPLRPLTLTEVVVTQCDHQRRAQLHRGWLSQTRGCSCAAMLAQARRLYCNGSPYSVPQLAHAESSLPGMGRYLSSFASGATHQSACLLQSAG